MGIFGRRLEIAYNPRLDLGEGSPEQVKWGLLAVLW
jgi:hypothetical protein